MKSIKILTTLAFSWILYPAIAQDAGAIRRNFENCVYASANSQFRTGAASDPNLIAENGFLACQTEERAITAVLALAYVPPAQAEAMLIKIRLQIKATIRDVFANPKKYSPPQH